MSAFGSLRSEMSAGQRVMLVGPPGCGKTAVIHAVAKDCGIATEIETEEGVLSTVFRASLMERVDWTGCMVPDQKMGVTRQLPFAIVKALQNTKKDVLVFFDDLGQAPLDTQASFMRGFDSGFFPSNVRIWAATNRPGDKAGVGSLCEPLRSRFDAAYLIPTPETQDKADGGVLLCEWLQWMDQWLDWALQNEAPPEIVAWHKSTNGKSLYAWKPHADPSLRMADFRSWGSLINRRNKGLRSLSQTSAVIGKAVAAEFTAFSKLADKLPTADDVWRGPKVATIPSDSSAQWLIACVLSQQVTPSTAEAFITYMGRNPEMPRVMTAFAAKEAYKRLKEKLSASKAWVRWFEQNQELFALGCK